MKRSRRRRTVLWLTLVLAVIVSTQVRRSPAFAFGSPRLRAASIPNLLRPVAPHGWHAVFADDFTAPASLGQFASSSYGNRWMVYPDGWKDTSKHGTYSPSKVLSVHDGELDYFLHSDASGPLVAALVPRATALPRTPFGRYDVRFRADATAGYKTAWLLWPDSEKWPDDGEIDFPEGNLDGTINAYAHYASPDGGQDAFEQSGARYTTWHTATTIWSQGRVDFYLDGQPIGTSRHLVPANSMHWVLQTETSLGGDPPTPRAAGHVFIDWVMASKPAG